MLVTLKDEKWGWGLLKGKNEAADWLLLKKWSIAKTGRSFSLGV